MLRHHRFWRPVTPLSDERRKNLHIKHTKWTVWERLLNPVNPLDYNPAAVLFVKHLYQYAKEHDIDSGDKLALALIHVKGALNADLNIEITAKQVRSKWDDMSREFFNFREFLEFPGIRLADNKKKAIAGPTYFMDVKPEDECWLFRRFRIVGYDFYKEMRFIIMQKKVGGAGPEAGPQGYYHIFDRNSDVGEEIMDIWDYNPEML